MNVTVEPIDRCDSQDAVKYLTSKLTHPEDIPAGAQGDQIREVINALKNSGVPVDVVGVSIGENIESALRNDAQAEMTHNQCAAATTPSIPTYEQLERRIGSISVDLARSRAECKQKAGLLDTYRTRLDEAQTELTRFREAVKQELLVPLGKFSVCRTKLAALTAQLLNKPEQELNVGAVAEFATKIRSLVVEMAAI